MAGGDCKQIRWFMGLRASDTSDYFEYVKVALLSARQRAPSLIPYLIYSGAPNKMTAWFELNGGTIVPHDLSFIQDFQVPGAREDLKSMSGAYLRLDVPSIVATLSLDDNIEARYVLYTDVDIMFMQDINSCTLEAPAILALGGEGQKDKKENTGVMYFNVTALSEKKADIVAFGKEQAWNFPAYDQGLILAYFSQDHISQLPPEFNWKGYWGCPESESMHIYHWHGPKPRRHLHCLLDQLLFRDTVNASEASIMCKMGTTNLAPWIWMSPDQGACYKAALQTFEMYSLQLQSNKVLRSSKRSPSLSSVKSLALP